MSFLSNEARKKINYYFFWINLIVAFIVAYAGSYLCIVNLAVSFFCWSAYKYQDMLEEKLKNIDDKK